MSIPTPSTLPVITYTCSPPRLRSMSSISSNIINSPSCGPLYPSRSIVWKSFPVRRSGFPAFLRALSPPSAAPAAVRSSPAAASTAHTIQNIFHLFFISYTAFPWIGLLHSSTNPRSMAGYTIMQSFTVPTVAMSPSTKSRRPIPAVISAAGG